jgi:hypothetical protein
MDTVVPVFFETELHLKLFHWQTPVYAHHKAVDSGLADLRNKMDEFVEVGLGKDPKRRLRVSTPNITLRNMNHKSIIALLRRFADFLEKRLPCLFPHESPDLLNLRDELLAATRRIMYLLSLR